MYITLSVNHKNNQCALIRTQNLLWCSYFLLTTLQIGQPVLLAQTHQRGIDLQPAERRPD